MPIPMKSKSAEERPVSMAGVDDGGRLEQSRGVGEHITRAIAGTNTGEREMTDHDGEFAKDVLRGAKEIALFMYGDREKRRKVYHLVATSNLPVFKLGSTICARKSVLLKWIRDQEDRRGGLLARPQADGRIDPRHPGARQPRES